MLAERSPGFPAALDGDATMDVAAGVAASAEELRLGADVLGLDQVGAVLDAIAAHARTMPAAGAQAALLLDLAGLAQQLGLLEEISGHPAGAQALQAALAAHAGAALVSMVQPLLAALEGGAEHRDVVALAAAARTTLSAAGLSEASSVVLLVEELASRVAQAEVAWTPAMAALACGLVGAVQNLQRDINPSESARLRADWEAGLGADGPAPDRTPGRIGPRKGGGTAGSLALAPELREALAPAQLARLEQRIAEGWHAYDLLLDTEAEPELAADLTAWLSAHADVLTSRTVGVGGMSWFRFLFAARDALGPVRGALEGIDPGNRCVRSLRAVLGAPANPPVDLPLRAPEPVIRVPVDAVERLLDGLDDLRVQLGALGDVLASSNGGPASTLAEARGIQSRMEAMHRRIRASCLDLRVVPIDTLFGRFPRIVRELAARLGRDVGLEIEGGEVRIDKAAVDLLADPLMHLVRNALDHGIEPPGERAQAGKPAQARLVLSASEQGDGVHITVADDGRGLDRAAILARATANGLVPAGAALPEHEVYALLFRSGFSTAAAVTEISGRGVGLDVVSHAAGRLGGSVEVSAQPGRGTRFTLRVPASASLVDVLVVDAGEPVAVPRRRVVAVCGLDEAEGTVELVAGQRRLWHRGAPVPLHGLAALLSFPAPTPRYAVVVEGTDGLAALAVGGLPRRQEVFLKELHPVLAGLPMLAGASVLSDGRAVLVLDLDGVLRQAAALTGAA